MDLSHALLPRFVSIEGCFACVYLRFLGSGGFDTGLLLFGNTLFEHLLSRLPFLRVRRRLWDRPRVRLVKHILFILTRSRVLLLAEKVLIPSVLLLPAVFLLLEFLSSLPGGRLVLHHLDLNLLH